MDEILNQLNEEQAQLALEVARKAKEMGIDPKLAVALAYRESRFDPKAKGSSGEVGLMQVMPATAKGLGYTPEELGDPAKNIEIGLTYLKQGLEKFGDPVLAAAGYNAGHNHPYFTDPENSPLPASTKEYLKGISNLGGFATPEAEEAPAPVETPASESDFMANKSRIAADVIGAGAGAALSKGLDVASNIGKTGEAIRQIPGALAAAQAGAMQAPPGAQAPQGAPMGRPVAGGPAGPVAGPVGGPAAPLTQMGGSGTANYGKAFGLTDIEANRALDMSKNPGGANDLINQRRQAMQKIQSMGGGFVENPNYGGIMTPQQGAGGGPRASFVQAPGAPGGMSQLPPSAPISATPPPPPPPPAGPGPLSQAAGAVKQGVGAVLRSPLASGAMGGLSMAESGQEAQKRLQAGDTTGAMIAGTGGLGGAMQMMPDPRMKVLGAMISAASPLTLYLRENLKNQTPMPDPTEEELLAAERPAFGIYPKPVRRAPLRPRIPEPGTNLPPVEFMR